MHFALGVIGRIVGSSEQHGRHRELARESADGQLLLLLAFVSHKYPLRGTVGQD